MGKKEGFDSGAGKKIAKTATGPGILVSQGDGFWILFSYEEFTLECANLFHKNPGIQDAVNSVTRLKCYMECGMEQRNEQ